LKFQGTQARKEMKKTHNIGIMSYEKMKKRNIAIARGEYTPVHGDPKVYFIADLTGDD